jgi:hypothetical protein
MFSGWQIRDTWEIDGFNLFPSTSTSTWTSFLILSFAITLITLPYINKYILIKYKYFLTGLKGFSFGSFTVSNSTKHSVPGGKFSAIFFLSS